MEKPKRIALVGSKLGLSFVLNTTTSDYYFSTEDHVGFTIQIFSPSNFADERNGDMTSILINTNTKSYLKLRPTTIQSKMAIHKYPSVRRGCLFEHELFEQYAGHYSFNDCLLKCKLRKLINVCDCMPFFLPTNFPDGTVTPIKCTLANNKCLNRWKCNLISNINIIFFI